MSHAGTWVGDFLGLVCTGTVVFSPFVLSRLPIYVPKPHGPRIMPAVLVPNSSQIQFTPPAKINQDLTKR